MKIKIITTICLAVILGTVIGVSLPKDEESAEGVGLAIPAKEDLKELKGSSDLVLKATIDGKFETTKELEDEEHDVYLIDRVYTATVNQSFKDGLGKKYKKGDTIKVKYPVGLKQMKNGELEDELLPFSDEMLSLDKGEYMLFLDQLEGEFFFSNINHVYKKASSDKASKSSLEKFNNIASDKVPTINAANLK